MTEKTLDFLSKYFLETCGALIKIPFGKNSTRTFSYSQNFFFINSRALEKIFFNDLFLKKLPTNSPN